MKRLIISYFAFFPVILVSRFLLIGIEKEFDFIEKLGFSLNWTLILALPFLVLDLLESFSFTERKFYIKKSKKAVIVIGLIVLIGGLILPKIETTSIFIILIVLVITDLIRNKIVSGKFLRAS